MYGSGDTDVFTHFIITAITAKTQSREARETHCFQIVIFGGPQIT